MGSSNRESQKNQNSQISRGRLCLLGLGSATKHLGYKTKTSEDYILYWENCYAQQSSRCAPRHFELRPGQICSRETLRVRAPFPNPHECDLLSALGTNVEGGAKDINAAWRFHISPNLPRSPRNSPDPETCPCRCPDLRLAYGQRELTGTGFENRK